MCEAAQRDDNANIILLAFDKGGAALHQKFINKLKSVDKEEWFEMEQGVAQ